MKEIILAISIISNGIVEKEAEITAPNVFTSISVCENMGGRVQKKIFEELSSRGKSVDVKFKCR